MQGTKLFETILRITAPCHVLQPVRDVRPCSQVISMVSSDS
jgi:hypothetical protein